VTTPSPTDADPLPPADPHRRVGDEAIAMRGVTKRFGAVVANDEIDFSANFGEVHALVGENGAGKSTLMSILAGRYRPDAGTVAIGGEPVRLRAPADAIARGVGMVYQHFMLVEPFTVVENVLLGERGHGLWLEAGSVVRELERLSDRHGLGINPRAHVWQLSVGEQQRVEILRLLYRGARILVVDEPTAVLTPQESAALLRTLRAMAGAGYCVIFISHKLAEVLAVADRVTVLRRGRVVAGTTPAATDRATLARLMVGRDLAPLVEYPSHEPRDLGAGGGVVLSVEDLGANGDNGLAALTDIDFAVRAGEILGVAGVAGNGQRELAEVLTGLRPALRGHVTIAGVETTHRSPGDIAALGVAHIPEDRLATGVIANMDLAANAILRTYRRPPLSRGPFLRAPAIAAFVDRLLAAYDITAPNRSATLRTLSGGNQQKLLLARELDGRPRLIVAVHPTRGVDVGATEAIHRLLREQRAGGAAVLLISEDLDELLALADRIAVLFGGRVMGTVGIERADPERLGLMMAGLAASSAMAGAESADG
jgi:simple sugar transport system ATP-binding protein